MRLSGRDGLRPHLRSPILPKLHLLPAHLLPIPHYPLPTPHSQSSVQVGDIFPVAVIDYRGLGVPGKARARTDDAFRGLGPAGVRFVGVDVGDEAVFVGDEGIPERGRLAIEKFDFDDRFCPFKPVFPRNHHPDGGPILFGEGFAVNSGGEKSQIVRHFLNRQPLRVGPGIIGRPETRTLGDFGVVKGREADEFRLGGGFDIFQQQPHREADPGNHHRPGLHAAKSVNPFFEGKFFLEVVEIVGFGIFHQSGDFHPPVVRGQGLGRFPNGLRAAKFVIVVVAGGEIFGGDGASGVGKVGVLRQVGIGLSGRLTAGGGILASSQGQDGGGYTGADEDTAPLHRLGGDQWDKIKRKAAQKAHDVAAELLDIYARRAARQGVAFPTPGADYDAFATAFEFEETPDQQRAIEAILTDMADPKPMDRVVCGDVGFGKTEVAMRAAFVAVNGGKQVAVLVPTTLLAQQHYQNFSDRFADWPVRVESLSRFKNAKESKAIMDGLADGTVDIVVGTHKLLQGSTRFKNLGLAIIDEEHRFGVRHKEQLKNLRAEVDVLTLTATPIPRTLNMAMSGMRDLSIIATPPVERHPIKTFVTAWNDALIQEACQREINRGGQIYFLHNEVETIENMAQKIEALVPEARVDVAHGQMRERELERVMRDFYHRRFNLLVCTTIVESGIDVPSANTIVINRADKLGLAQLHQLRGRVGRSHHRAYAYLITPPPKAMTEDAKKRLEAIESLEDLGAGFTLATHDLEIRGAGELLGDEQSGQIHEIGFTLYMDLLERAVQALKAGRTPELDRPLDHGAEIDLGLPALLPSDYLPDVQTRLVTYKRIASAADAAELKDLQVEMIDRFGLLPEPTKNLFAVTGLKLKVRPLGIRKIEAGPRGGRVLFAEQPNIDPMRLIKLIQTRPKDYKLDQAAGALRFNMDMTEPSKRIAQIETVIGQLAG